MFRHLHLYRRICGDRRTVQNWQVEIFVTKWFSHAIGIRSRKILGSEYSFIQLKNSFFLFGETKQCQHLAPRGTTLSIPNALFCDSQHISSLLEMRKFLIYGKYLYLFLFVTAIYYVSSLSL